MTTISRSPIERFFRIQERESTVRREVVGGVATFLTMSYIVFVNPAILSAAGLPFDAVAVMTALAAAVFTLLMALTTNLPLALASGLGINAVVAFDIILGRGLSPAVGMACVVIEGVLALILVVLGLREAVVRAVPTSLKLSIGVGIGLFITLVGLREGGIVVNNPATGIGLGDLSSGPALIALGGLLVAMAMSAAHKRGAILVGVATSTILGVIFGVLDSPDAIARWPHSGDFSIFGDSLGSLDDALTWALVPVIFSLFMTDFFDTVGTAYAVTSAGDMLDERGEVPRIRPLLMVDSAAAAGGGVAGVSSVTTYVESGAGVSEGARTGLASVVTAGLFGLTIFFVPILGFVAQDVQIAKDTFIHPAIAPALIMVGYLMIQLVRGIEWDQPESAIPAFLIIIGVPLTFSIAAGIGFGVFGYIVAMIARGKIRQIHPIMWGLVPLFIAYFEAGWLESHVF